MLKTDDAVLHWPDASLGVLPDEVPGEAPDVVPDVLPDEVLDVVPDVPPVVLLDELPDALSKVPRSDFIAGSGMELPLSTTPSMLS